MAPAPKAKYQRRLSHGGKSVADANDGKPNEDIKFGEDEILENGNNQKKDPKPAAEAGHMRDRSGSPMTSTLLLRRSSAGPDGRLDNVPVRASFDDIKQHLKHLGPSNRASNPKSTRSTTVKIKPGIVVHDPPQSAPVAEETIPEVPRDEEGEDDNETTSLLRGKIIPKDGAHAVAQTYGATGVGSAPRSLQNSPLIKTADMTAQEDQATQTSARASATDLTMAVEQSSKPEVRSHRSSSGSEMSPVDALSPYGSRKSLLARSGSITEQVVETRGIKKTVLETTSSNDEDEEHRHQRMASRSNLSLPSTGVLSPVPGDEEETSLGSSSVASPSPGESATVASGGNGQNGGGNGSGGASKKKNRRKKRKGGKS